MTIKQQREIRDNAFHQLQFLEACCEEFERIGDFPWSGKCALEMSRIRRDVLHEVTLAGPKPKSNGQDHQKPRGGDDWSA